MEVLGEILVLDERKTPQKKKKKKKKKKIKKINQTKTENNESNHLKYFKKSRNVSEIYSIIGATYEKFSMKTQIVGFFYQKTQKEAFKIL